MKQLFSGSTATWVLRAQADDVWHVTCDSSMQWRCAAVGKQWWPTTEEQQRGKMADTTWRMMGAAAAMVWLRPQTGSGPATVTWHVTTAVNQLQQTTAAGSTGETVQQTTIWLRPQMAITTMARTMIRRRYGGENGRRQGVTAAKQHAQWRRLSRLC